MKLLLQPLTFLIALVLNVMLVFAFSFNLIFMDSYPILGEAIQIFPSYHYGIWQNFLLKLSGNADLSNGIILFLSSILISVGVSMMLKKRLKQSFNSKHRLGILTIGALVGLWMAFTQSYAYVANYQTSLTYAFAMFFLFLGLYMRQEKGARKYIYLIISAFSFSNCLTHFIPPEKHANFFLLKFLPYFGPMTLAEVFIFGFLLYLLIDFGLKKLGKRKLVSSLLILCMLSISCQDQEDNRQRVEMEFETLEKTPTSLAEPKAEKNAYFGDLHLHTAYSFDAYVRDFRQVLPEDSYRFARGDTVLLPGGEKVWLDRPLDFLAVTDHAEYMGVLQNTPEDDLVDALLAEKSLLNLSRSLNTSEAFLIVGRSMVIGTPLQSIYKPEMQTQAWKEMVDLANTYNDPGTFTAFAGYEWTSVLPVSLKYRSARNLHRIVLFGNGKIPELPYSSLDSKDPEDLWAWMDRQREKGVKVMAIPHNGNMSDGMMYANYTLKGYEFDADYAQMRMRNEPVSEVVQEKGQAMTHPVLSSEDEFADFSLYQEVFGFDSNYAADNYRGSYVRQALKDGLVQEERIGENPFKYGLIGSTDSHVGLSDTRENQLSQNKNYYTKRLNHWEENRSRSINKTYKTAGGLAGVWAESNTRENIFNALESREVFATSGSRMQVRFFGSWDFPKNSLEESLVKVGYSLGVAMGKDLPPRPTTGNKLPQFLVWAIKDPDAAHLDRIQIVKGWLDEDGKTHEKVYNVVWAHPEQRKLDAKGKIPPITSTVDLQACTYSNEFGQVELKGLWTDPDFNPNERAVYYLRVLEIPTPGIAAFDAKNMGREIPEGVEAIIQERAWSSPIWYSF
ncbi:MAG: DUF3604 domain-containing protein [Bacteroidia bacterium]|nr:DUF3604 domain-containing protein [Bacteroidia bacterium]